MELRDPSLLREAALVAGHWIESRPKSGRTIFNPATGDAVGRVPEISDIQVNEAIDAATVAQRAWARVTAGRRAEILRRWYQLILENKDDLALIMTLEQGKPLAEAAGEIQYGASYVLWFAEEARRLYGEIIPGHQEDKRLLVIRQPVGVVAAITPWNFPCAMITRKVAPALAAGCAVVLKPAEQTPFSAIALAVLAERAGLPAALFSVVTGNAVEIGGVMTSSQKIRKLTFTGSTAIGALLYGQCAPTIKKLSLELGGNAPFIVFDDADLNVAVEAAILAKFRNNGQTCVCANRIYVQKNIYDKFSETFSERVRELSVGSGLDANVSLGPLIDKRALLKVEGHIADACNNGAEILVGGKRHQKGGLFFEPTVLKGVTARMRITHEETFGPVAPIIRFDTEDEAISAANDTEFGLAAYFCTNDASRVFRVSEALECGIVGVNTGALSTAEAPFGGRGMSGIGREGSRHGIEDYTELKYICVGSVA
ncbi:NAD-dependent succinate-semialdehyde dehydrogenase [Acetobacter sacchari]|uniref:NAD-dependent succinate-semialdehyde dehydrogenase n=1 Tax=Acetobacter sacchari TaxID=2661687 RepID=A0ABS3M019_9PROT|nr:NAD-dependent succinate-semialdehyde dehydrogenase [Acetobacter sacchari]MBO1361473.1 NAD-dependent succinate-semialdehyde dehydrogenase [Acetobacter sacchari]